MTMLTALIKTMRPRQWPKNAFVLAAVVFDHQLSLSNPAPLFRSLIGVLLFCFLSSAVYIINDIKDVESDRKHPVKCKRPIAAGTLPIPAALTAMIVLLLFTLPASFLLSKGFFMVAITYFVINLGYSLWLKHVPLVDVLILASGFVLRVAAGVTLIHVERFSPWLYICMTLLALYVGFGKRRAELTTMEKDAMYTRRVLEGYNLPLLDQLITIVSSSTILAYSLYTFSAPNLPTNHTMMLSIPFVLYGVFRYLYLIQVRQEGGAPEELLLTDRPLQVTVFLWGLTVFLIIYVLPRFF